MIQCPVSWALDLYGLDQVALGQILLVNINSVFYQARSYSCPASLKQFRLTEPTYSTADKRVIAN